MIRNRSVTFLSVTEQWVQVNGKWVTLAIVSNWFDFTKNSSPLPLVSPYVHYYTPSLWMCVCVSAFDGRQPVCVCVCVCVCVRVCVCTHSTYTLGEKGLVEALALIPFYNNAKSDSACQTLLASGVVWHARDYSSGKRFYSSLIWSEDVSFC